MKITSVADLQAAYESLKNTVAIREGVHETIDGYRKHILICGGIGGGAQTALAEAGIRLYGGVSGEADAAVDALLAGALSYDPNVRCSHHDHAHREGGHTCGEHSCGHHGCH